MEVKVREVGGRNDSRVLTFTTQQQFDLALKNLVRARFLAMKQIHLKQKSNRVQEAYVEVGQDTVTFAEIRYSEDSKVGNEW